jgi:hypothetical protein
MTNLISNATGDISVIDGLIFADRKGDQIFRK